jgi:hypothetical protein
MNKIISTFITSIVAAITIFYGSPLLSHGFTGFQSIKLANGDVFKSLVFIKEDTEKEEDQWILSYDFETKKCIPAKVKAATSGTTNCYMRISLDKPSDEIFCTPTQEFYLPASQEWVPAYKLKAGDTLLGNGKEYVHVLNLELLDETRTVYLLEIEGAHNYMVGTHRVLTHNAAIPWDVTLSLWIAFGEGAAAGGTAGAWFGPVGIGVSAGIGGLLYFGWRAMYAKDKPPKQDTFWGVGDYKHFINKADAEIDADDDITVEEDDDKTKDKKEEKPKKPADDNPYKDLSDAQIKRGIKSTEKRIEEHEKKLKDYLENPDAHDHKGILKEQTPERRAKIIRERKEGIKIEIKTFKDNIRKAKEVLRWRDQ